MKKRDRKFLAIVQTCLQTCKANPANELARFLMVEKNIAYETHLQDTVRRTRDEAGRLGRADRPLLSFGGLIAKQLKFLAWKIWLLQGMVLAALCAVFFTIYTTGLRWRADRALPKFLCICSAIIVMSSIPILKRASRYKMFELEQSTHYAVGGGLLAQLSFIGIGDIGMLAMLALIVSRHGLTISVALISLVIPFLTAAISCLMLWTRTEPTFFQTGGVALCILSSFAGYKIGENSMLLPVPARWCLWAGYGLVCAVGLYHEYRRLYLHVHVEKML